MVLDSKSVWRTKVYLLATLTPQTFYVSTPAFHFHSFHKGEVSSKMTYIFKWLVWISTFFRKLFVNYFIKNYHAKVKFQAKNDLLKVGV